MSSGGLRIVFVSPATNFGAEENAGYKSTDITYATCCIFVLYFKQFGSISKNPKQLS